MPRYQITAPNGQVFEINAPDGASEQDALAYAQSQFGGNKSLPVATAAPAPSQAAAAPAPQAAPQQEGGGMFENLGRGAWQGVTDLVAGPAQLVGNAYVSAVNSIPGLKDTQYAADIKRNADQTNGLIRKNEADYQAATPGSVAAGVGRVGANVAGALAGGGGKAVQTLGQAGELLPFVAGAGRTAQTAGRVAGTAAGSAGLGGVASALAPVTEQGDYWSNKAGQVGVGMGIGAVLPFAAQGAVSGGRYIGGAARSLVEPFTDAGKTRIAGDLLHRFAQGGPMSGNASELIPGSVPRLTEATGNPGLNALETGLRSNNPLFGNLLNDRDLGNAAARAAALADLAGSDASRKAAVAAREAATSPLYEAATSKSATIDGGLRELLRRPSVRKALGRADELAQERGGSFTLAPDSPLRRTITNTTLDPGRGVAPSATVQSATGNTQLVPGLPASIAGEGVARGAIPARTATTSRTVNTPGNVSLAGEGAPRVMPYEPSRTLSSTRTISPYAGVAGEGTAGRNQPVSGQDLQTLKMAMDAMLEDPASGIAGQEIKAVKKTRDALVNWMEREGNIPEFKAARETYAEMSKPMAQMDIAKRLMERYSSAVSQRAGSPQLKAEGFTRALQDENRLLKSSDVFSGYKSLSDVFTPDQMRVLNGLADDMSRAAVNKGAGKAPGSNTFQNMATNYIMERALPGPVRAMVGGTSGPIGTLAGKAGNLLYGGANEAIQNRLGSMLLNPQEGLAALSNVRGAQPTLMLRGNGLLNSIYPDLLPAATVGGGVASRNGK